MRRVLAWTGIILLGLCILATVICAIAGAPGNVIIALLYCDMAIPFFLFIVQWFAKIIKKYTGGEPEEREEK